MSRQIRACAADTNEHAEFVPWAENKHWRRAHLGEAS